jgi:hypothetical protein
MESPKPDWLPDLFPIDPWTIYTFENLYEIFQRDFIASQPIYRGKIVWVFPEKEDNKEKIFWHLTSRKEKTTGQRLPDLRRSERLPWVRVMLQYPDKAEILDWDYEKGDGTINTYVWLKGYSFVVIMKKYPNGERRLITSYWINYPNERRRLEKRYFNRII